MARKKLNERQLESIITSYKSGVSPSCLSKEYGVHPTTIRRYLRDSGVTTPRLSHRVLISPKNKVTLRKILADYKVVNADMLIQEIDKCFELKERKQEKFITIII